MDTIFMNFGNSKISYPYKNNRFITSIPTQNEKFKLHDESHSVSDIQDYLGYILKNLEKVLMIF